MSETGRDIETSALKAYLRAELDAAVVETEILHDGLNLSLAIAAEDGRRYVLRRPNKFRERQTFNSVHQEYETLLRLRDTAVPAPVPVSYVDDESILGAPFLLTTHLGGETVPLGAELPGRFRNATARNRLATHLIDALAAVHSVDVDRVADVADRRPIRDQLASIVEQFDEATSTTGHDPPGLWDVAHWLKCNVPSNADTTLVHGDFRPSNVLFTGTDEPDISGVLDWETAFIGDPLTELGYLLLRWRDDGDPTPSLEPIERRYSNETVIRDLRETNDRGLAPFTSKPGSPSRRELVARYERETGITFENDRFYRAFAAFVLATVWADLHRHRVEAGEDSDWEPYVEYVSLIGESIVAGDLEL